MTGYRHIISLKPQNPTSLIEKWGFGIQFIGLSDLGFMHHLEIPS